MNWLRALKRYLFAREHYDWVSSAAMSARESWGRK